MNSSLATSGQFGAQEGTCALEIGLDCILWHVQNAPDFSRTEFSAVAQENDGTKRGRQCSNSLLQERLQIMTFGNLLWEWGTVGDRMKQLEVFSLVAAF